MTIIEFRTPWGIWTETIQAETVGQITTKIIQFFKMERDPEKIYKLVKSDGEVLEDGKSIKVYSWKPVDYAVLNITGNKKVQMKK